MKTDIKILTIIVTIISTMCLGILLLIPIVNLYLLKEVIRQETGVKTKYWLRPFGNTALKGDWIEKKV